MQVGVCTSFTGLTKITEYDVVCGASGVWSDESPVIRKVVVREYGYWRVW